MTGLVLRLALDFSGQGKVHCNKIKGAVCQYYFDVKPFNLTACFIMKCDTKCYDMHIKMEGHGQQCTIMYERVLLTSFLEYNVGIDWPEVLYVVEQ